MDIKNKLKSYLKPITLSSLVLFGASKVGAQTQDSTKVKQDSIPNTIYHNQEFVDSYNDIGINRGILKFPLELNPKAIIPLKNLVVAKEGGIKFEVKEGRKSLDNLIDYFENKTDLNERETEFYQKAIELSKFKGDGLHSKTVKLLDGAVEDGIINVIEDGLYVNEKSQIQKGSYLLIGHSKGRFIDVNSTTKEIKKQVISQSFPMFFQLNLNTPQDTTQTPQEPQEEIFITSKGDTAFSVADSSALEEGYRAIAYQDSVMEALEQKVRPGVTPKNQYPTKVDSIKTKTRQVQRVQEDSVEVTPSRPKDLSVIVGGHLGGINRIEAGVQYGKWGFLVNYGKAGDESPKIKIGDASTTGMQGKTEAQNINYKAFGFALEHQPTSFFFGAGFNSWIYDEKRKVSITKLNGTTKTKEDTKGKTTNSARFYAGQEFGKGDIKTRLSIGYDSLKKASIGMAIKYNLGKGHRK